MTTALYWLLAAVASLMAIGTLLAGLFAWRMWVRPEKPVRISDSGRPGEAASLPATIPSHRN
jgi:hypothetical protein